MAKDPCLSCGGTGEGPQHDPIDRTDPVRQWLEAEEEFTTGQKPVVNMTVIPGPQQCFRCGGGGRAGGL